MVLNFTKPNIRRKLKFVFICVSLSYDHSNIYLSEKSIGTSVRHMGWSWHDYPGIQWMKVLVRKSAGKCWWGLESTPLTTLDGLTCASGSRECQPLSGWCQWLLPLGSRPAKFEQCGTQAVVAQVSVRMAESSMLSDPTGGRRRAMKSPAVQPPLPNLPPLPHEDKSSEGLEEERGEALQLHGSGRGLEPFEYDCLVGVPSVGSRWCL